MYYCRPCPGSSIYPNVLGAEGGKPKVDYRGGKLQPSSPEINVLSWNVEGLTDEKLEALQTYMGSMDIGILALQETHSCNSEYYVTHCGFLLILSGPSSSCHDSAGVGFLVAPWLRRSVVGFCQASSRMASLKIRIIGGKAAFISAYAPHSGKTYVERQTFYNELGEFIAKTTSHGPKFVLGDFNARLYRRLPGEEDIIGHGVFTNLSASIPDNANRYLLAEMCAAKGLVMANTFFDNSLEETVTCYNVGQTEREAISWQSHSQIDHALCSEDWLQCVGAASSNRRLPLSSHHYPIVLRLILAVPKKTTEARTQAYSTSSLASPVVSNRFVDLFEMQLDAAIPENCNNVNIFYAGFVDVFATAKDNALPCRPVLPKRPWISSRCLALIEERCLERLLLHFEHVAARW